MRELGKSTFGRLCLLQILAIAIFIVSAAKMSEEKEAFQDVGEFVPVEAYYTGSDWIRDYTSRHRRSIGYNNSYQYTVKGKRYRVTFYYELSRGSNRTLYYNPTNPDICSKFQTLSEAKRAHGAWILVGVVFQGIVIFFAIRSVRKEQEKSLAYENKGVVVSNDFDMSMNYGTITSDDDIKETTDKIETISFQSKNDSDKVESIPFPSERSVDEVESIPFHSNINMNENRFELYTEDEYKNLKK